jgi:hypothetical protein
MTISGASGPQAGGVPPPPPTEPTLWATTPIAIGKTPVEGLTVTLQVGPRIRGRVEFEGTTERPEAAALQRIAILLEPATAASNIRPIPPGRIEASGNFVTGGVPGGKYFVRTFGTPEGWFLKEARYEGTDLTDTAVTLEGRDLSGVIIVFTDRPTELSGTVRNTRGADADATVVIFPTDADQWITPGSRRIRSVSTSRTGIYKFAGLPPGDYYVAAVADDSSAEWQDPEVLASLARDASRVSLDDGERKTADVRTLQKR